MDKSFGTDPRALARSTDPGTSKAAAERVKTTKMEQVVYEVICRFKLGCIPDDVRLALPDYAHSAHKRISSLIEKGYVFPTGEELDGQFGRKQRVVIADVYAKDWMK